MRFKDLFTAFCAGEPIKREPWTGYWRYYYGKVEMHNKDGNIVILTDTKDILFTLAGIMQDDWELADVYNCGVLAQELGIEPTDETNCENC